MWSDTVVRKCKDVMDEQDCPDDFVPFKMKHSFKFKEFLNEFLHTDLPSHMHIKIFLKRSMLFKSTPVLVYFYLMQIYMNNSRGNFSSISDAECGLLTLAY